LEYPGVEHYVFFVAWMDSPKRKSEKKLQIDDSIAALCAELVLRLKIPQDAVKLSTHRILKEVDSDQVLFVLRITA